MNSVTKVLEESFTLRLWKISYK